MTHNFAAADEIVASSGRRGNKEVTLTGALAVGAVTELASWLAARVDVPAITFTDNVLHSRLK